MKPELSAKLIRSYLNNTCTEGERALVEDWYNSFEKNSGPEFISEDKRQQEYRVFNNIISTPHFQEGLPSNRKVSKAIIYRTITILSGAAAVIILMLNILFKTEENINVAKVALSANKPPITKVNYSKNILRTELPDKSVVWLNPNSSLEYPAKFSGGVREVKMQGEAFFEVTEDKANPFIIYSGGVITRVWGTSFLIKAYRTKPTEVSVVTGKVSVKIPQKDKSEVLLFPSQKVVYLKEADRLKKDSEKKISNIHIWEKATMSFENKPVKEVIEVLNKEFKTRICTADDEELESYVLDADFNDINLPAILEIMGKSLNVDYEISNENILIKRKLTTN